MLSPKGIKAPESSEGISGRDGTGALRKPTTGGGERSLQIPSPAWVSEPPASRTGLWRLPGTSTREVGLPGAWTPERSLPEVQLHMPVAVGPYEQSQPSCFDRVKMGFVMGCAMGMAAGRSSAPFPVSGSECGVGS
ncbi:unnamed protein product [Rangifer tarandus platyrhynchus]|uniref:Uncharacterized protein n=2 Tax=Rangifer tarandus platyrhynchus TaxID=3082113 RepID=A0ACB0E6L3_RANTA|nr:unnamed protein product [Rangifer tarandus platyrhynchus]CAI9696079.1 unnamed protein product [Rangifer tarandus platyrhynchus]